MIMNQVADGSHHKISQREKAAFSGHSMGEA